MAFVIMDYWGSTSRAYRRRHSGDAKRGDLGADVLLATTDFGVALISGSGRILDISQSVTHMLGYAPSEARGRNLFNYLHSDDVHLARRTIADLSPTRPLCQRISYRVMHISGEWRVHQASLRFEPRDEINAPNILVNFIDVTDHRRARARAGKRDRELEHLVRLHSLGELAAALSHELMQPFAAITGFIGGSITRLESHQPDVPTIVEALRYANAEAERAGLIMHRMRQFMARHEPASARIDVRDVIHAIQDFIRLKADRAECSLVVKVVEDEPLEIVGDAVLLGQVVLNLAFNGIEAMQDIAPDRRLLIVAVDRLPRAIRIRVEDRGCGLPNVSPDTLFESFFTTKPNGSGIGLSLCRTIVEAYAGHIWVSRLSPGTRFHVSLPFAGDTQH